MMSFIYGLLTSFSPCVLAILPVLLNFCKTFKGSMVFLAGNMVSYAMLGICLAYVGFQFQEYTQSWPVILMFSLILLYLSASCFNLVNLPMYYVHSSNVFIMGLLTPIIVSPCMTPALGAIITTIVSSGNYYGGVIELMLFGLGRNIPLIIGALGFQKSLKNTAVRKYSSWVTKINGVVILCLIAYLWKGIL